MENFKRSAEEYEDTNAVLRSLHEERRRKKDQAEKSRDIGDPAEKNKGSAEEEKKIEVVTSEKSGNADQVIFPDGCMVFMTPIDFIQPPPAHFLSFRQLLYEDLLNIPNRPKTLISLLLTTFCAEPPFIQPIISAGLKLCLVVDGPSAKIERISPNFTIVTPKIGDKWGKFHAKLFILKFPNRLRVVVTSANLIKCDWSLIGQVIWFQDFFPASATPRECGFKTQLSQFLQEIAPVGFNIEEEIGVDLDSYDFTGARVELVASVPGRYKLPVNRGLARIKQLVPRRYKRFTYQCSSVGSISNGFQNDVGESFARNAAAKFDVVFPSFRSVQESELGNNGAGVFFLQENAYTSSKTLRESLCNTGSPVKYPQIKGHLSHSKVIIIHDDYEINDDTVIYMGSHNLSAAAWGKYEKNSTQIYIKNFELGVVFTSKPNSKQQKEEVVSRLAFAFPAPRYLPDDRPWFINTDMK